MDWLKRFFFYYEDEEYEEEVIEPENNNNNKKERNNEYIEMQTRVAYHYPQNERFRNEAPTYDKNQKTRIKMNMSITEIQKNLYKRYPKLKYINGKSMQYEQEQAPEKEIVTPKETESQYVEKSQEKMEQKQKEKQEKPKFGTRGFRPSEVPSPIYGFQKRTKKTDVVEFELRSFESSPSIHADKQLSKIEDVHSEYEQDYSPKVEIENDISLKSVQIQDHKRKDPSENIHKVVIQTNDTFAGPVLDQESVQEENSENENKNASLFHEKQKHDLNEGMVTNKTLPLTNREDNDQQSERENVQYDVKDHLVDHQIQQIEVVEPSNFQSEQLEKEEKDEKGNREQARKELTILNEEKANVDVNEESEERLNKDPAEENRTENQEAEQSKHTHDLNDVKKDERRTNAKRQIPFNVIMLKSDREKLKKKQEEKRVTYKRTIDEEKPTKELNHIDREVNQTELQQSIEMHDEKTTVLNEVAVTSERYQENILYDDYQFPARNLLQFRRYEHSDDEWIQMQSEILDQTLKSFNVDAKVVHVSVGPAVTRFELAPEMGVKVSKITSLTDDIKLSLAAKDIRIEAPIPGKHTIGIEVPNRKSRPVFLREIIDQPAFLKAESPLTVGLGLDITGKPIMTDLKKMPHGLIAGATGSGKSVSINTFIVSLLYKARPDEVKLLLIDPKMVELAPYNGIPHLISPVITNVKAATQSLKWAVEEMERRYELFAHLGVRDISKFNERADNKHRLPYIVIIIDELADLMMMAPADVEESIARIAQKARACGIHLLIATQRPSVDVITGLIKANIPTRIAFSVSSQIDSRTILDVSGAERLLGKGDMLFIENGTSKPVRIQGAFISDEEIEHVVEHVRSQGEPDYLFVQEELIKKSDFEEQDELLLEACKFAVEQGNLSTSSLQRHFRIGYNRAARMIDMMEEKGIITESKGSKPRDVLITEQDLEKLNDLL